MEYWIIYVLKLEDDCWYIGRTTQKAFKRRMKDHWNSKASDFTLKHKPIRIFDIEVVDRSLLSQEAEVHENNKTLKYAKLHGTEFVRGGGYCQDKPNWPTNIC